MRVLFVTYAERTHFFNMVPVAWALRTAGHEVRVASQPALTDTIVQAGLTAVPVGQDHSFDQVLVDKAEDEGWADRVTQVIAAPEAVDYETFVRFLDEATKFSGKIFNDPMVDDLVAYTRQWEPDLIVWEMFSFAGAVAARATGTPHVRLLWGADVLVRMRQHFLSLHAKQPEAERADPLGQWLSETCERFDCTFAEELITGQHTLDHAPASMRLPLGLSTIPVRYVPYNGPSQIPDWLREPPKRPRVCITAGISLRNFHGYDPIPLDTLKAFGDLDLDVVATLVPRDGDAQVDLPDNVRLVEFVPMHALLPTCSAVMHIGAAGVVATATRYGVPQLTLVLSLWDAPVRAAMLRDIGAGLSIVPDEMSPENVRDRMLRLVNEASFQDAAQRLSAEVLAEPSPNEIVPALERLAR